MNWNSRSSVIFIIGYWRLVRGCGLDFVLNGMKLSRLRSDQRKGDQGDRPLHPDAKDARMALILTEKENVPPAGKQ